jgi:hypothetical protein
MRYVWLLFLWLPAGAQVSIGVSPLGILAEGAAGVSVGYQWKRWEIWTEPVVLLPGWHSVGGYQTVSGFRDILQVRRFIGRRGHYFIGAELRFKYQSSSNYMAVVTNLNGDTLPNYTYTIFNNQVGGAVFIGQRINFGRSPIFMEMNVGPGIKYNWASQPTYPAGYSRIYTDQNVDDPFPDKSISEWLPYLSFAVRFGLILR